MKIDDHLKMGVEAISLMPSTLNVQTVLSTQDAIEYSVWWHLLHQNYCIWHDTTDLNYLYKLMEMQIWNSNEYKF
jgi:hypothetical protein